MQVLVQFLDWFRIHLKQYILLVFNNKSLLNPTYVVEVTLTKHGMCEIRDRQDPVNSSRWVLFRFTMAEANDGGASVLSGKRKTVTVILVYL